MFVGTPFEEIYDLAMLTIEDYRLDYLYQNDPEAFSLHFQGWLEKAVAKFDGSVTCLEYNIYDARFRNRLSKKEKDILADYIVMFWFEWNKNDAGQINLQLQGRDKKRNAESSNLKEKAIVLDKLREKVRQDVTDYQLNHFDNFVF